MYVIRSRFLPLGGYAALTLGPFMLLKRGRKLRPSLLRHEQIHWHQCRELLVAFFYLWYAVEWLLRFAVEAARAPRAGRKGAAQRAYYRISFEREAYACQNDPGYFARRPFWAFLHYL
ncbi:MAG: hypothetical protein J6M53_07990 [Bacteroidaceae bacterium]|nr:hypothetical protein [Bacteroidaceae bacterium]